MEVSVKKPGSPQDVLEHYGKKGMKWGVRNKTPGIVTRSRAKKKAKETYRSEISKARTSSGPKNLTPGVVTRSRAKKKAKETYRSEISKARTPRTEKSFRRDFPTAASRSREIKRARIQEQALRLKVMSETNPAKRQKLYEQWRDSPDRAVALRTTRGEKVVLGVLAGALAVPSLGAAPAALAGYGGTTVAIRKGIERGQTKRARMIEQ